MIIDLRNNNDDYIHIIYKTNYMYKKETNSVFHRHILVIYTFSWGEFKVKNATLCLHIFFWHFFCCFSSKKICFYHFYFFFHEVSSFRNRILTNQKPELMIRNCQWNCMQEKLITMDQFMSMVLGKPAGNDKIIDEQFLKSHKFKE